MITGRVREVVVHQASAGALNRAFVTMTHFQIERYATVNPEIRGGGRLAFWQLRVHRKKGRGRWLANGLVKMRIFELWLV